nr:PREDICTED: extensin-2-like [Latimeria chalumnae]|eukprot:XP_005991231.1 PREDICTED: extensin-2-like [Latimeria chalumnae]
MGFAQRKAISLMVSGVLLAISLLPDLPEGGPIASAAKTEGGNVKLEPKEATNFLGKLVRQKRNPRMGYPDNRNFWDWYQYFTDTGNAEKVHEMDKVYLEHLQKKNREEAKQSYVAYLQHLKELYGAQCDPLKDTHCAHYLTTMQLNKSPEPPLPGSPAPPPPPTPPPPAPYRSYLRSKPCDPRKDLYCRSQPLRQPQQPPVAYYFSYASPRPYLTPKQQSELADLCDSSDTACIQYYIKTYVPRPAVVPAPIYNYQTCDPQKDPSCAQTIANYPHCDPETDPRCRFLMLSYRSTPPVQTRCNPYYDSGCIPEPAPEPPCDTTYDPYCQVSSPLASRQKPRPQCDPRYHPYCQVPSPVTSEQRPEPQLECEDYYDLRCRRKFPALMGKTKEGHDCYIYYDKDCHLVRPPNEEKEPERIPEPVRAPCNPRDPNCRAMQPPPKKTYPPNCDPYSDPNCLILKPYDPYKACNPEYDPNCQPDSPQSPLRSGPENTYHPFVNPDGYRKGVIEPDPDCDPEYDPNCRLRRVDPNSSTSGNSQAPAAPQKGSTGSGSEDSQSSPHPNEAQQPGAEVKGYNLYNDPSPYHRGSDVRYDDPYQGYRDPYKEAFKRYGSGDDAYLRYDDPYGYGDVRRPHAEARERHDARARHYNKK